MPNGESKTVLLCVGTRPEIIKLAPVYHALRRTRLAPVVLHTGQHDGIAGEIYRFFGIAPRPARPLARDRVSLGHLSARLLEALDGALEQLRPDAVLVQGDTSSAMVGALAAFYHKIPVGHVEAGLRSHYAHDPFPEEKNRELISRLADWHFVPTRVAVDNLRNERVAESRIFRVGNTIVDAVRWASTHVDAYVEERRSDALAGIVADGRRWMLVTAHRRESWDGRIADITVGVGRALARDPELHAVWPLHPNPTVRDAVHRVAAGLESSVRERLRLIPPLGYPELLWIFRRAWLVLTDSGGIQEEAVELNVPALILRDTTERPEILQIGAGALVGTSPDAIESWVGRMRDDNVLYESMRHKRNPFGDGQASERIARVLERRLTGEGTDTSDIVSAVASSL